MVARNYQTSLDAFSLAAKSIGQRLSMSRAFVVCHVRHNVSLSPCHATEPRVGINEDLTKQLMRYSEPLQGVVLSFHNVQLDRPYGAIVNEMPFIHCKVVADALVFRPTVGMQLRGVVNKIGSNHVGMLFAGVFNGSVAEAELPKGFVHNYAQDCWYVAVAAWTIWLDRY